MQSTEIKINNTSIGSLHENTMKSLMLFTNNLKMYNLNKSHHIFLLNHTAMDQTNRILLFIYNTTK